MYVEILNVTLQQAYYVCGRPEDMYGMIHTSQTADNLMYLGETRHPKDILNFIAPVLYRLTSLTPNNAFQVRLFTMEPDSPILTKRILLRGVYWVNWNNATKAFTFEKV